MSALDPIKPEAVPAAGDKANSISPKSPAAKMLSLSDLKHEPATGAALVMNNLTEDGSAFPNPLRHVKTTLSVRVGTAEITVGQLLSAKEEQVLRLDQTMDQPVEILLEGQVVARGTLVAVEDHFGVRITELPHPLRP
jgi:flagellar motor switch protein FliN